MGKQIVYIVVKHRWDADTSNVGESVIVEAYAHRHLSCAGCLGVLDGAYNLGWVFVCYPDGPIDCLCEIACGGTRAAVSPESLDTILAGDLPLRLERTADAYRAYLDTLG